MGDLPLWENAVLERSGSDILWSGTGNVRFQVNDQTQAYSITPLGDDNQPPIAVITPGGTLNVAGIVMKLGFLRQFLQ